MLGMDVWEIAGLTGMWMRMIMDRYGHQDSDFQVSPREHFESRHDPGRLASRHDRELRMTDAIPSTLITPLRLGINF